MSNTSLKQITIPKLNTSNFGKSIKEAFENINLNFQKLSNLGINQGAPGRSCVYIPINLGAAFIYNPYEHTNNNLNDDEVLYYNSFLDWERDGISKLEGDVEWDKFAAAVESDYQQFFNITGYSKQTYAQIACILIWGNPSMFGFSSGSNQVRVSPDSLAGALHARYGKIEGAATVRNSSEPTVLYGNWLWQLAQIKNHKGYIKEYYDIFYTHWKISPVGKLIVAFSPSDDYGTFQPVGSFEYWFIDPRYRCGKEITGKGPISDISCVLRWSADNFKPGPQTRWEGSFEILEIFPTIRVGEDGKYYWFINGLNTGIPVRGEDGADGQPGQMVVVERIENVFGWDPVNHPNGTDFWSPKASDQTIMIPTYSGIPSREVNKFKTRIADNVTINAVAEGESNVEKTFQTTYEYAMNTLDGITHFKYTEYDPWLDMSSNASYENFNDISHLYRIFRIVGRDKFWTYDPDAKIKVSREDDEWDRAGDPSCDSYYFEGVFNKKSIKSHIARDERTQSLIKSLDGTLAIVLPGPAYQGDRTDTTFWFATLKTVRSKESGLYELVAYCSPNTRQTTQLDEHSQVGMMMSFDPYTFKKTSDNRNKPRGLILPIGSIAAATETPSDTWAAHIIHSDTGGFTGFSDENDKNIERRGKQNVAEIDRIYANSTPQLNNNLDGDPGKPNSEFSDVIRKRVLHVGSVNDVRLLNYVENVANDGSINGAVPGRYYRREEGTGIIGPIGTSNFFGETVNRWFVGSELHVDEPVTITRYRDLKARGRLLDVEGDVIIGPQSHKNVPAIRYGYKGGGLWVASTLSDETIDDPMMYSDGLGDGYGSIFPKDLIHGKIGLTFDPFIRNTEVLTTGYDAGSSTRWRTELGRWKGTRGKYTYDNRDLNGYTGTPSGPLFSALFNDTIGARMVVVEDGIAVFDPDYATHGGVRVPFSVDAMGNIQTYGREIRSNANDAAWYFHTNWQGNLSIPMPIDDSYVTYTTVLLSPPKHNKLVIASDHELHSVSAKYGGRGEKGDALYNAYWETSNIEPMSEEADGLQIGYYHSFGFANETGLSRPTFPQVFDGDTNYYATDWGTDTGIYLPTMMIVPADVSWIWGSSVVSGINPRAFKRIFDGKTYGMRFGSTVKYGMVISKPARQRITPTEGSGMDHAMYRGEDLTVKIDANKKLSDDNIPLDQKKSPLGESFEDGNVYEVKDTFGYNGLFNEKFDVPVGLWNMYGSVTEGTSVVGGNMLGYGAFALRGQARAKSFRRHKNSRDENSTWAFLLDDGKSSHSAPAATYSNDTNEYTVPNSPTPLFLDFGKIFGKNRLIRFGSTWADINVNETTGNIFVPNVTGKDAHEINDVVKDYNGALIASLATSINKSISKSGYLFNQKTTKKYGIDVFFSTVFGVCKLDIVLKIDQLLKGNDTNHHGVHKHRENCYGIATGQAPKVDDPRFSDDPIKKRVDFVCKVDGVDATEKSRNCGHNGQITSDQNMTVEKDGISDKVIVDCTGFNSLDIFNEEMDQFKPPVDQWFPVISMWNDYGNCNWVHSGTDYDRGFGKGLWFKLDTNGKLTIPWYSSAGSIFTRAQTITISFCWLLASATNVITWDLARTKFDTNSNKAIEPRNPDEGHNGVRTQIWNDWENGGYEYLWYRQHGTSSWSILEYAIKTKYVFSTDIINADGDDSAMPAGSTCEYDVDADWPGTGGYLYKWIKSSYRNETGKELISYQLSEVLGDDNSGTGTGDDPSNTLKDDSWTSSAVDSESIASWINTVRLADSLKADDGGNLTNKRVSGLFYDAAILGKDGKYLLSVDIWSDKIHIKHIDGTTFNPFTKCGKFQFTCTVTPGDVITKDSISDIEIHGFEIHYHTEDFI